jgi:hypothetical protein
MQSSIRPPRAAFNAHSRPTSARAEPLEPRQLLSAIIDPGFGGAVSLGAGSAVQTMTLVPGNKILASETGGNLLASHLNLLRFNSSGSLDSSFGRRGVLSIALPHFAGNFVSVESMRTQSDGKILAAGIVGTRGHRHSCESHRSARISGALEFRRHA